MTQRQVFKTISTQLIIPAAEQPRRRFDEYELSQLCESIKENGIIQPLSVRKNGNSFVLIAGERRLRAAKMAGLKKVPCIVFSADETTSAFYSVIENLQRQDLTVFEEANGINRLIKEFGLSHCDVAAKLGIAPSTLSNKLRLLSLSVHQQDRIAAARLTERHARALLRVPEDKRDDVLDHIIAEGLTLAQTESYIEKNFFAEKKTQPTGQKKKSSCDIRLFANSLAHLVNTMVTAGIPARQEKKENDNYIEYKIKIPKPPTDRENSTQLKIC